ncbi:hypothetical protein RUM44_003569 [Polyplax serrata]|uniref:Uncharacterized protein n=1 Tax=Polyplax serrata TaxID=468196 RepID=A0ABR1AGU5_POLSC
MKIAHRRDQQEIHSPPLLSPFPLIPNCIAQKRRQKLRKRHEEKQDLTEANSENKSDEMAAEETSLTFFKNTGRDGVMQNVSAESVKHLLTKVDDDGKWNRNRNRKRVSARRQEFQKGNLETINRNDGNDEEVEEEEEEKGDEEKMRRQK